MWVHGAYEISPEIPDAWIREIALPSDEVDGVQATKTEWIVD